MNISIKKIIVILLVVFIAPISLYAQPANNDPCSATPLGINGTCVFSSSTNDLGTASSGVPAPGCANYVGSDVWFSVTVPANGMVTFDSNTGVITDGGMAIYSGTCSALTLIECDDDDSANGLMPSISATGLTPGATIWIRFWEYGNDNNGTFQICASSPSTVSAPANNAPCNAITLPLNTSCSFTTYSNAGATGSSAPAPGCANYVGGDVWFSVSVPSSGTITFDSNSDVVTDGGMAIYSGTCGALTLIECDDDDSANGLMPYINATGLTPGDTIWVRFWEYGNDNNGTFQICAFNSSTIPSNCTSPACTTPVPDDCNSACGLGTLSSPPDCPVATSVTNSFCLSNVGAIAESPYTYLSDCQGVIGNDMSSPAADTWYSFTATSTAATFTVNGLTTPNIALYQGNNCIDAFGLGCNIGATGIVSLTYNSLFIGQNYLIRVSGGDELDVGNFTLDITSFNNCDNCLTSSSLVVNPAPTSGLYLAGQTVEFCYTVNTWNSTSINWLHGVVPYFGAGWDLSTLAPTSIPPSCDLLGDWDWYTSVTSDNTGLTYGPGFYYDSSLGDFPADYLDSNPGDNFGDDCLGPWTFCFEIAVNSCPPNIQGTSLNVSIETYGDSETGAWSSVGCTGDPVYEFFSNATCCVAPVLTSNNPSCNGSNNGSI